MSSLDFGQEQLTQPSLDMSETQGLDASNILELMHELGRKIGQFASPVVRLLLYTSAEMQLPSSVVPDLDRPAVFVCLPLLLRRRA